MKNVIPEVDSQSMDIVADNISKLKELFPEAFSEGKVDFDALKEVLGDYIDGREERYSFTWNGKSKARMLAQTPSTGTLRPCKEESVDWDNTQNLFIEGDNLEVLKLLQKSYHKKVKMIYIDPPYNTGKDFVYKDNFKDNIKNYKEITGQVDGEGRNLSNNPETSGRYHTDWLNMMYPRLKLARNLLKDDGVIFISIDDNEIANLKKICDEIFGEENCRGIVSRPTGTPSGQGYDILVNEIDYVLVYAKTSSAALLGLPFSKEDEKIYDQEDQWGKYLTRSLRKTGGEDRREDRPTMYYAIKDPDGNDIYPVGPTGYESRWRCGEDSYIKLISENRIEWKKGDDGWKPYQKFYLEGRLKQPSNLWQGIEGNKKGSLTVKGLLKSKVFETPKPVGLIERCLRISTKSDDLILDFFAGSSTTAHAVYQLNVEESCGRKFIMVQLPEVIEKDSLAFKEGYKTIADLSKQRVRRASAKIKEENPDYQGDLGFKVFKLDSTNIKPWELDFDLTEQDLEEQISNIKLDRKEDDVLFEVLLKYGLDLTLPITEHSVAGHKVFDIGMGALMICLSDDITLDVVEGIAKLKDELKPEIMRVVFKDAGFADDVVKTNAVQILKQAGIEDVRSL
ncbi:site-specific DNA-methyltransferase [Providencia rettgeri]|uniref:site-specific DNA-methyltransferase (adenine-specific) n=2 Tax=Morganellaceae TaxID=1903414 RepID=A0A9N8D2I7_PRORE|nr:MULTISPECIES: site-specific DNA-methyltransferase [Providencia]HEM8344304.1 site-specific DNA-methyltransferase [Providencia stuartii]EKH6496562.1 site-specific DNA-methyltransferase [Providencia rettgeri]ELR5052050.1 site-specific DNA-methyltransferase [Providencia rettgeri]ELR5157155.1 site-specific DNA-methyltransferase [Providencia rettgeri]ELR5182297.1 site-specific DNA-methyltransferase [Providencia rettgeri]